MTGLERGGGGGEEKRGVIGLEMERKKRVVIEWEEMNEINLDKEVCCFPTFFKSTCL